MANSGNRDYALLNRKFGAAGTVIWIILGVVLAGGAIVSIVSQSIVPIALCAIAGVMVLARRFARPRRTGVIGKRRWAASRSARRGS